MVKHIALGLGDLFSSRSYPFHDRFLLCNYLKHPFCSPSLVFTIRVNCHFVLLYILLQKLQKSQIESQPMKMFLFRLIQIAIPLFNFDGF